MYLHIFTRGLDTPQRFLSPIPGLNINRICPDDYRSGDVHIKNSIRMTVNNDCLIHVNELMKEKRVSNFDFTVLPVPIVIKKGDEYTWETIEC